MKSITYFNRLFDLTILEKEMIQYPSWTLLVFGWIILLHLFGYHYIDERGY